MARLEDAYPPALDLLLSRPTIVAHGRLDGSSLQQAIDKVDIRLDEVLLTLFASASEVLHAESGEDFAAAGAPAPELWDTLRALRALETCPLGSQGASLAASLSEELERVLRESAALSSRASALRAAARQEVSLRAFREAAAAGDHARAAELVPALRSFCDAAGRESGEASPAAADVSSALREYADVLVRAVASCAPAYDAEADAVVMRASSSPAAPFPLPTPGAWAALESLGAREEAVRALGERLLHACLSVMAHHASRPPLADPGAEAPTPPPPHAPPAASPEASTASSWQSLGRSGTRPRAARPSLERHLYKCLRCACEQVLAACADAGASKRALGEELWPKLAKAYVSARLRPLLPRSAPGMAAYQAAAAQGLALEQRAARLGLLPPEGSTAAAAPVARAAATAINRYLHSRRTALIAEAQGALRRRSLRDTVSIAWPPNVACDEQTIASCGTCQDEERKDSSPALFRTVDLSCLLPPQPAAPALQVSRACAEVCVLLARSLAAATRSGSPALTQALCGAVVDVAALAEEGLGRGGMAERAAERGSPSISPPPHEGMPPDAPFAACLRAADCFALRSALRALPGALAPRLQELVHRSVGFVNSAARLQRAAEQALQELTAAQFRIVDELAAGLRRFQGLDAPGGAVRARRAAAQLTHALQRLGAVVGEALPPRVRAELCGPVLERAARGVLLQVQSLDDIAVDESEQIPAVLEEFVERALDAVCGGGVQDKASPLARSKGERDPAMSLASAFDASASSATKAKDAEDDWGWGEDEGWGEIASAQPPAPEPPSQAPQSTGDPDLAEMGFGLDPLRVRELVSDAAPSLIKLKEMLELLDIRLVVIRERWEEGRLAALGFAPQEVAHLVRALFEDTEMREDFLHLLDRER